MSSESKSGSNAEIIRSLLDRDPGITHNITVIGRRVLDDGTVEEISTIEQEIDRGYFRWELIKLLRSEGLEDSDHIIIELQDASRIALGRVLEPTRVLGYGYTVKNEKLSEPTHRILREVFPNNEGNIHYNPGVTEIYVDIPVDYLGLESGEFLTIGVWIGIDVLENEATLSVLFDNDEETSTRKILRRYAEIIITLQESDWESADKGMTLLKKISLDDLDGIKKELLHLKGVLLP